jgi:hypothetical protein
MHNCAFCGNPLMPLSEWKASDGQFFCSEFCADAGESAKSFGRPRDILSDTVHNSSRQPITKRHPRTPAALGSAAGE